MAAKSGDLPKDVQRGIHIVGFFGLLRGVVEYREKGVEICQRIA